MKQLMTIMILGCAMIVRGEVIVDAKDFGFATNAPARVNALALQKALDGGKKTVRISTPGEYKLDREVYLDSDTTLDCVQGVVLSKATTYAHILVNRGALNYATNENITVRNVEIKVNGFQKIQNEESNAPGMRGQLAFHHIKNVKVFGFRCFDCAPMQYCIQFSDFDGLLMEDFIIRGKKDGVHLNAGKNFVLRKGILQTGDDGIAINAGDWPGACTPIMGSITDGLIEDITDEEGGKCNFARVITGAWIDWHKGMRLQRNDIFRHGNNVYAVHPAPLGTNEVVSLTPPTHTHGVWKSPEGINFQFLHGDGQTRADIKRVTFRNIRMQCQRTISCSWELGAWARLVHPELPRKDYPIIDITLENVVKTSKGAIVTGNADANIVFKNCRAEQGPLAQMGWSKIYTQCPRRTFVVDGKSFSDDSGNVTVDNMTVNIATALKASQMTGCGQKFTTEAYDNILAEVTRRDIMADEAWMECTDVKSVRDHAAVLRAKMLAAVGGMPPRCPLNVRCTGTFQRNGYSVEKLVFESETNHYVTAHLFLPDPARFPKPWPGIIVPCGHSFNGKMLLGYNRSGVLGALNGFATMVYDPIDQGERIQLPPSEFPFCSCEAHNNAGVRAHLLGWSTARWRIRDGIRALDVLVERNDVDANRLGVMGMSGGGTLTSYIMAVDERVRCAAPAGYLTTLRDVCATIGPQDAEQNIFGQLNFGLNHLGYMMMQAPAPQMMVSSHADFFPFNGSLATFRYARKLYNALGIGDRLAMLDCAGPHTWYESSRQGSLEWMNIWLRGGKVQQPDVNRLRRLNVGLEYKDEAVDCGLAKLGAEALCLQATPEGCIPGVTIYGLMQDELARLVPQREPLSPVLLRKVAGIRSLSDLPVVTFNVSTQKFDSITVRHAILENTNSVYIPTVTFIPANAQGAPVLLVADNSRMALTAQVKQYLAQGRIVMVTELRGVGEADVQKFPRGFYGAKRADENIAVMMQLIGQNLVAHRAEDLAIAASELARFTNNQKIEFVACGKAVIPAAHTFYLQRAMFTSFSAVEAPLSWSETINNPVKPYCFADCVYGALKYYDWPQLIK